MAEHIDHKAEVECLLHSGALNNFMAGYLLRRNHAALDEPMWDEALRDAETASQLEVDNDEEFKLFFYIDHFAEDLVQEMYWKTLDEPGQASLKKFMFGLRNTVKYDKLEDFYKAAHDWLLENKRGEMPPKRAYKNVGRMYQTLPRYDLDRWSDLVKRVQEGIRMGFRRRDAVLEAATELEMPERLDFLEWYRNHLNGEDHKYDLNDEIKTKTHELTTHAELKPVGLVADAERPQEGMVDFTKVADAMDERHYYLPRFREDPEPDELKPVGRPSGAKIGLEPVKSPAELAIQKGPEQNAMDFEAARNKLMGRVFAIDKLLEKYKKVLKPEELDGIEDSLNDLKKKIRKLKMAASIQDSLIKTAGICEQFGFDDGVEELRVLAAEASRLGEDTNIFTEEAKNEKLKIIVARLYDISVVLKNREVIRHIAEIDILLDELRMASFFPEIQDAQAKLIDAFGYASNKIEDVLPKLRGGLVLEKATPEAQIMPADKSGDMVGELRELSKGLDKKKPAPQPEEDDKLKQLLLPVRR